MATITNDLHNTSVKICVTETYETDTGLVAVVDDGELARAAAALCGMDDCCCTYPNSVVDDEGNVYAIRP